MTYQKLRWPDYVVWVILLIMSLSIGLYFGIIEAKRRKQKKGGETNEFLLGSRKMSALPVACSLMASFFSAITLLGTPNEIYQCGIMYWFIGIGYALTIIISSFLFVPVFYNMTITSSYEYLGLRFCKANQIIGAVGFILQTAPYMGIVLYGPCLALGVVMDANIWIIIVTMAVICTVYTTVGGIKAVVWTDVLQLIMMFGGMMAIIIKGAVSAGGFQNIMKTAYETGRMDLDFSPDPKTRHSFWALTIGGTFLWTGIYAINQTMIQRAISVKSLRQSQLSYFINLPGMNMLLMVVIICGLVLLHTFHGCDPLIGKDIAKSDQIVPLYVSKFLTQYPGVAGIFVAGIFSGGLSTLSSGLNSLSAVTLQDIVLVKSNNMSDRKAAIISKILVVFYGAVTLFFAYLSSLTEKILEAALGLFGLLSGPALGVFTLGMFFPFTNYKGAIVGHIISQVILFWIGFGYYIYEVKHPKLEMSNLNCTGTINQTIPKGTDIMSGGIPISGINNLYAISYLWYTLIGWVLVLMIGIPLSILTGNRNGRKLESHFISPVVRKIWSKHLINEDVRRGSAFSQSGYIREISSDGKEITTF